MHKLVKEPEGKKLLLMGNEAVVRGALEVGLAVAATYPGTPSSEISANLFQIAKETDIYFEYSTNEKVALEVAAAAANSGLKSMAIMKHVGVNVAADALMTLAYVGVTGAMVVVSADDPYMFSSQNEQDNRYYARLSGLPMLEPATPQEALEMTRAAFDLSARLKLPVILRTTTRLNHGTGPVRLGKLAEPVTSGSFEKDPFSKVTVPAVSRNLHKRLVGKIKEARLLSEESGYNRITGSGPFGIVANGVSRNYVKDAVADLGITDKVRLLEIGFSHPMPDSLITSFLQGCTKVLVVEEGEPYMEEYIRSVAQKAGITIPIAGKDEENLFSVLFEYDPGMVRRVCARFFSIPYDPPQPVDTSDIPDLPQRPPNLCAGCSHRAVFYAVNRALEGMANIRPTDIGCYTLGFLPPLSCGDFLICMGSSVGTGCGFSLSCKDKVVSFIGDSTFFHSGIPGLVNAVFNNHDLTLVILDNQTTAMTGHQPHPGVDTSIMGLEDCRQVKIEDLVRGIGVPHVVTIRPYNVKKSIDAIREAVEFEGVSVVIAKQDCVLLARNIKKKKPRPFMVTDRCKNHRVCINELACPAFYIENERVRIDPALCSGCSVCAQICPEKAISPAPR